MRIWTNEEIEYLKTNWGIKSIPTMSKVLNRSEKAISIKRSKLKLGAFLDNGDYITLNQLIKVVGYNSNRNTRNAWIRRGLPLTSKKVNNNSFKVIKIDKFWKWAEENQTFLDFSKFIRYSLGKEPQWVEAKRQRDIINNIHKKKRWTQNEDEKLIFLVKQYKYNYAEIAEIMQRTENSIRSRLNRLNIKTRPIIKEEDTFRWTDEEKQILTKLIKEGYDYKTIQRKLPKKTAGAIRNKLYSIYGTGNLDKIKKDDIDKIQEFKVSSNKRWTDEEKQILKDMTWEGYSTKEIQQYLPNRSMEAIKTKKREYNRGKEK
jgi:hypothetical protein